MTELAHFEPRTARGYSKARRTEKLRRKPRAFLTTTAAINAFAHVSRLALAFSFPGVKKSLFSAPGVPAKSRNRPEFSKKRALKAFANAHFPEFNAA